MIDNLKVLPQTVILSPIVCFSKKRLFEEVSECASSIIEDKTETIIAKLNDRERLGSTVVAKKVAIPHAVVDCDRTFGILCLLNEPIAFNTVDTDLQLVDIAYTIFISKHDDYDKVQEQLISIAKIFSYEDLIASLHLSHHDETKIATLLYKIDDNLYKDKQFTQRKDEITNDR